MISANGGDGVELSDASDNLVEGDFVGTDPTGSWTARGFGVNAVYLSNRVDGVILDAQSQGNTIGGTTAGARDVIAGNVSDGVAIVGASYNLVEGDHIGNSLNGLWSLGNTNGVLISNPGPTQTTTHNTIGGTTSGARNLISGNFQNGVVIQGAALNLVEGDYIGTDPTGTLSDYNLIGVLISGGASANTIGGVSAADRNVISGNDGDGVEIQGSSGNLVAGDYIGLTASGEAGLGNSGDGVHILAQAGEPAAHNTVGGTSSGARDVIAGNLADNVEIDGAADNLIAGDYVGIDAKGALGVALPNGTPLSDNQNGVVLDDGATANTIGGTAAGAAQRHFGAFGHKLPDRGVGNVEQPGGGELRRHGLDR